MIRCVYHVRVINTVDGKSFLDYKFPSQRKAIAFCEKSWYTGYITQIWREEINSDGEGKHEK